jgi:hypothetical protein
MSQAWDGASQMGSYVVAPKRFKALPVCATDSTDNPLGDALTNVKTLSISKYPVKLNYELVH